MTGVSAPDDGALIGLDELERRPLAVWSATCTVCQGPDPFRAEHPDEGRARHEVLRHIDDDHVLVDVVRKPAPDYPDAAIDVACPQCQAPAREFCSGQRGLIIHAARAAAWKAAQPCGG